MLNIQFSPWAFPFFQTWVGGLTTSPLVEKTETMKLSYWLLKKSCFSNPPPKYQNHREHVLVSCYQVNLVQLSCDSSSYGVGTFISHIVKYVPKRPIAFASRNVNETKRRYAHIEKEAISIAFGVQTFHNYWFRRKFTCTLVTDHKLWCPFLDKRKESYL